jgi:hypothetical protein
LAEASLPVAAAVKAPKIESGDPSPCSGGSFGGMDATGNLCAEYPVAGMNAGSIVAAKR